MVYEIIPICLGSFSSPVYTKQPGALFFIAHLEALTTESTAPNDVRPNPVPAPITAIGAPCWAEHRWKAYPLVNGWGCVLGYTLWIDN